MQKVFEAILPGWKGTELPQEFPWHVRFFLRSTVLLVQFFAFKKYLRPFGRLTNEEKQSVIQLIYHHPKAAVRSVVQFWKVTAFMTQC